MFWGCFSLYLGCTIGPPQHPMGTSEDIPGTCLCCLGNLEATYKRTTKPETMYSIYFGAPVVRVSARAGKQRSKVGTREQTKPPPLAFRTKTQLTPAIARTNRVPCFTSSSSFFHRLDAINERATSRCYKQAHKWQI